MIFSRSYHRNVNPRKGYNISSRPWMKMPENNRPCPSEKIRPTTIGLSMPNGQFKVRRGRFSSLIGSHPSCLLGCARGRQQDQVRMRVVVEAVVSDWPSRCGAGHFRSKSTLASSSRPFSPIIDHKGHDVSLYIWTFVVHSFLFIDSVCD